ncbi:MAG: hypothetical protein K2I79_00615, partial [Clostridia bacterium]|nr:hypothetical protein [Clostridia bacterium]
MMLYESKTTAVKPKKRRYKLSSFKGFNGDATVSRLPCDYTGDSINFGYENGCLTGGTGLTVGYGKDPDGRRWNYPVIPLVKGEKLKLSVYNCGREEDNFCDMLAIGNNNIYRCPSSRNKMVWFMHYFPELRHNEGVNYVTREGKYVYIMRGAEKGLHVF